MRTIAQVKELAVQIFLHRPDIAPNIEQAFMYALKWNFLEDVFPDTAIDDYARKVEEEVNALRREGVKNENQSRPQADKGSDL